MSIIKCMSSSACDQVHVIKCMLWLLHVIKCMLWLLKGGPGMEPSATDDSRQSVDTCSFVMCLTRCGKCYCCNPSRRYYLQCVAFWSIQSRTQHTIGRCSTYHNTSTCLKKQQILLCQVINLHCSFDWCYAHSFEFKAARFCNSTLQHFMPMLWQMWGCRRDSLCPDHGGKMACL